MKRPSVRGWVPSHARGSIAWTAALPLGIAAMLAAPAARAEDFLAFKYESYDESGGRVNVRTDGIVANEDIGTNMQLALTLMNDAIAGASPTGIPAPAGSGQVPLAQLTDHRKEWEADFSRKMGNVGVSVGTSQSREHDYVSRGWSLNTLADLNEKNTTLLMGLAGHDDDVETFFDPQHYYAGKQAFSAIAGITQVLGPRTFVTVNFTWGRETGDLDDQYKLVQKTEELVEGSFFPIAFAENRPGERNTGTLFTSVNRAYPALRGALEASYRFYSDTFGVTSSTVEFRWIQKMGTAFTVAPEVRLYEQGAARFYYYNLDGTALVPTVVPNSNGPAYSSDYRLSSFDGVTYGLKGTWRVQAHVEFQLAYDRYAMRGSDGLTPQSAYPVANIVSAGARLSW
jgi:hypothetical protein